MHLFSTIGFSEGPANPAFADTRRGRRRGGRGSRPAGLGSRWWAGMKAIMLRLSTKSVVMERRRVNHARRFNSGLSTETKMQIRLSSMGGVAIRSTPQP